MSKDRAPRPQTIVEQFRTPSPEWYLELSAPALISESNSRHLEAEVLKQDLIRFIASYTEAEILIAAKPRSRRQVSFACGRIDTEVTDRLWGWFVDQPEFQRAWNRILGSKGRSTIRSVPSKIITGRRKPTELAFLKCVADGMLRAISILQLRSIDLKHVGGSASEARRFLTAIRRAEGDSPGSFKLLSFSAREQIQSIVDLHKYFSGRGRGRRKDPDRIIGESIQRALEDLFEFSGTSSDGPGPAIVKDLLLLCGMNPPDDDSEIRRWWREKSS